MRIHISTRLSTFVFWAFLIFTPLSYAHASVIVQQSVSSDTIGTGALFWYQYLGTGLTGTVRGVTIHISDSGGAIAPVITCWNEINRVTSCGTGTADSSVTITGASDYGFTYNLLLDASKYYYLDSDAGTALTIFGDHTGTGCTACGSGSGGDMYFVVEDTAPTAVQTNTRFVYMEPRGGTTVSTSTATTTGAYIYVNPDDYVDGMYLQLSYTNQTLSYAGGSALDAFNSAFGVGEAFRVPITASSTIIHIATTTRFQFIGVTTGDYKIVTPTFLSTFFFLGRFFNGNVLVASTTKFTVGAPTGLDVSIALGGSAIASYLLTGTSTPILDCSLSGFDLTKCLVSVIVPNSATLQEDFDTFKGGFLSSFPWGYVTRFTSIITGNVPGANLPTLTVPIQIGEHATTSLSFDMQDSLVGGATVLDGIQDPNSGKGIKDIVIPYLQLFVALSVLIIIYHDIMAMGQASIGQNTHKA